MPIVRYFVSLFFFFPILGINLQRITANTIIIIPNKLNPIPTM